MTILAVGGEAECYEPVSGQAFVTDQTGGRFNANASRGAMKITQAVSEITLALPANQTEIWMHATIFQEGAAASDYIIFNDASGDPAYKIAMEATGEWSIYKYDGATWGSALDTSDDPVLSVALGEIDIHITTHVSTGEFTVYLDGAVIATFTGDTSIDNDGIGIVHFKGLTGGTNEMFVSEVIVADVSTIGFSLVTLSPDGNGTNTDWNGTYEAVDEFVYNDADFISSDVADEVSSFTLSAVHSSFNSHEVQAVVVAHRANNDAASAIDDIQAAVVVAGEGHFSSNLGLTKDGEDYSVQAVFVENPETTDPWLVSELASLQAGVKSVSA